MEKLMEEKLHNRFRLYADKEGISLDHPDDYLPWWECWQSAVESFIIDNCHGCTIKIVEQRYKEVTKPRKK